MKKLNDVMLFPAQQQKKVTIATLETPQTTEHAEDKVLHSAWKTILHNSVYVSHSPYKYTYLSLSLWASWPVFT